MTFFGHCWVNPQGLGGVGQPTELLSISFLIQFPLSLSYSGLWESREHETGVSR